MGMLAHTITTLRTRWHWWLRAGGRGWVWGALALLAMPFVAWATVGVMPDRQAQTQALHVRYWEDALQQSGLAQVLAMPGHAWHGVVSGHDPSLGYSTSAWWFDVALPPPDQPTRYLEIAYPVLDRIEVWVLDPDNRVLAHHLMGDKQPFHLRPVQHRNFVVPLNVTAQGHEPRRVLARVLTTSAVQFPVMWWSPTELALYEQIGSILQGLYLGVMLAMLAYNFILWLSIREPAYLWYTAWVGAISLFQASLNGLSFQYLWPDATQWNDTVIALSLAVAVMCGLNFSAYFLDLPLRRGAMHTLWRGLLVIALAVVLAMVLLAYSQAIRVVIGLAIVSILTFMVIGFLRWRERFKPAQYFLMAWLTLMLGGMVLAGNKFGLLPRNMLTENAVQVGSVLEVLLLSVALAGRLNAERRMRELAQAEVISTQRQANEQLEQRVAERTDQLEQLNQRLEQASRTDPLTGVFNRRHFEACLAKEIERCRRLTQPLGLILIDLDHFKNINDTHGHPAGDACLQTTVERIGQVIRPGTDVLARYGGEEFVLLVPQADASATWHVAERLRAHIAQSPVVLGEVNIAVTTSVGVSCRIPAHAGDGHAMLREADVALYRAKHDGRNRVVLASDLAVAETLS